MNIKKISIVSLNNKSRKGLYVYIRGDKGGRYYKYNPNVPKEKFKEYYTKLFELSKIKERSRRKREKELFINRWGQISTRRRFKDVLENRTASIKVNDADRIRNEGDVKRVYMELFSKGIVNDKDILRVITQTNNIEKIKYRLEHRIILRDKNNRVLGAIKNIGSKRLDEILFMVNNIVHKGTKIKNLYLIGTAILRNQKLNVEIFQNGTITKKELQVIFRK